jgi:uncharacterized Zn finger protein (UPF0148 family)
MYGVVVMLSLAAGAGGPACPKAACSSAAESVVVVYRRLSCHDGVYYECVVCPRKANRRAAPTESPTKEESDPADRIYPQVGADRRLLKEQMERIPSAKERKKVLAYWLRPGVDSRTRREFYDELMKKAEDREEGPLPSDGAPRGGR